MSRPLRALVWICLGAGTAGAQQRFGDAVAAADYASGSLTSLAACAVQATGSGAPTGIAGLPGIPGQAAVTRPREWYFAGAAGAAWREGTIADSSRRLYGATQLRARFVRQRWCAFDLGVTGAGTTSGAASFTVDARYVLMQNDWAPALEFGASARTTGSRAGDAGADPDATLRISATTPNLWEATVGRPGQAAFGDWWARLDLRARFYVGVGKSTQHDATITEGDAFSQAGGVVVANLLQKAVTLMASTEQATGGARAGWPQARDGFALAYRLNCCNDFAWLVARAVRHRNGAAHSTEYRIELAHLGLGAR